ncbi:MAG TPA: isoamylase early set domain-containing protein [Gemmatimonadaceae bacterium]|nr:isoamylase early set domain-containing protein [Gemmatimonadaceae bacterium]
MFEDDPDSREAARIGQGQAEPMSEAPDAFVASVARALRRPVRLDPTLDDRIMAAVAAEPAPASRPFDALPAGPADRGSAARRAWRWLRRPRTVRISPLGGLVGLAAAAALLVMVRDQGPGTGDQGGSREIATAAPAPGTAGLTTGSDTMQVVTFVLVAPEAQRVALVGDFNDWQVGATQLRPTQSGRMWSVDVPLTPGRHRYAFVVDGEKWLPDPAAPRAPGPDFGTPNSVVTVTPGRRS